ncbi:hypothetical protein [Sphingomonas sp. M1A8_2b]
MAQITFGTDTHYVPGWPAPTPTDIQQFSRSGISIAGPDPARPCISGTEKVVTLEIPNFFDRFDILGSEPMLEPANVIACRSWKSARTATVAGVLFCLGILAFGCALNWVFRGFKRQKV